jgi:hypothetical protein
MMADAVWRFDAPCCVLEPHGGNGGNVTRWQAVTCT